MTLQLRIASRSEVGLVRKNNQDSGLAGPSLVVVADGMGGAAAGDLASAVAIDALTRVARPPEGQEMLAAFATAIREANQRISDLVTADYDLEGMGTTVTGVMFDGAQLGLAHIGDSRAYLMHSEHLDRLTHDHTWVQSLVDEGKINEAEAAVHPHRSLLVKVLNGQPVNEPDLRLVPVVPGDRLLVCSDGLCGLVGDDAIASILRTPDLDTALQSLVEEALANGGIDNITVLLADVVESGGTTETVVLGAAAERGVLETGAIAASSPAAGDLDIADDPDHLMVPAPPSVVPPEDEARYNPQPPQQRRLLRALAGVLALLLVVGVGVGVGYSWTRTQFFVGAADERVAIYQGLADGLPGLPLAELYEVQPLAVGDLPPYYQAKVRETVQLTSLAAARLTVAELTAAAHRCQSPTATVTPRPSASPTTPPSSPAAPPQGC